VGAFLALLSLMALLLAIPLGCGGEDRPSTAEERGLRFYTGLETEPVYSSSPVDSSHSRYEFEPALQGDVVRHDFIIANDSEEVLEIEEVKGFPGCLVESYSRRIQPGLTGRISTLILTDSRGGEEIAGTIRARTSRENRPEIAIDTSLRVREFASLTPYRVWLEGPATQDLAATSIVVPNRDYPFTITGIKARKGVWFETSYREIESEGRRGYEITVRNTRNRPGSYQDVLFVQTDHPARPEFKIRIEGRIGE
jgi:hypothetical protein